MKLHIGDGGDESVGIVGSEMTMEFNLILSKDERANFRKVAIRFCIDHLDFQSDTDAWFSDECEMCHSTEVHTKKTICANAPPTRAEFLKMMHAKITGEKK